MPEALHGLGGRLPLLKPDDLSREQRKTYDTIDSSMVPWAEKAGFKAKNEDGTLIGTFNVVLLSPGITDAFLHLQAAEREHTSLSDRIRQVVILTVGSVWQCDYERYAHAAVSRQVGLSDETIRSLAQGEPAKDLSSDEQLAQRFTKRITAEREVDENLYREVEKTFGGRGIVDILYLAGCYGTISSMLNTFKVPAPSQ